MNKSEIIEAIQQTIIPNAQKGITAESLANLLIEIVNATPEGDSGQIVFYMGMPTGEVDEIWDAPIFEPNAEQKAHNVEMFNSIKSLPYIPVITIDMSEYYTQLVSEDSGKDISGLKYNAAGFSGMYVPKEVAEIGGYDKELIVLSSIQQYVILDDGRVLVE